MNISGQAEQSMKLVSDILSVFQYIKVKNG